MKYIGRSSISKINKKKKKASNIEKEEKIKEIGNLKLIEEGIGKVTIYSFFKNYDNLTT
jgi:hypothetical protein